MKKILSILLCFIMLFSCTACRRRAVNADKYEEKMLTMIAVASDTIEGDAKYNSNIFRAETTLEMDEFYISETEITQNVYRTVMEDNPDGVNAEPFMFSGKDLPAESITWYDALYFCNRLSEISGFNPAYKLVCIEVNNGHITSARVSVISEANGYRLPSESEWEYAARSGKVMSNYLYAGNDNADKVAWTAENAEGVIHSVKSKEANRLGIYDMSGNVWEWTYTSFEDVKDFTGLYHIIKGGAWNTGINSSAVSANFIWSANDYDGNLGFRVVRTANPKSDDAPNTGNGVLDYYYDGFDYKMCSIGNYNLKALFCTKDGRAVMVKAVINADEKERYNNLNFSSENYSYNFMEYLDGLNNARVIDLSDRIPTQEELNEYIGKTVDDLKADGMHSYYYNIWGNELSGVFTDEKFSYNIRAINPNENENTNPQLSSFVITEIIFNEFEQAFFEEE